MDGECSVFPWVQYSAVGEPIAQRQTHGVREAVEICLLAVSRGFTRDQFRRHYFASAELQVDQSPEASVDLWKTQH